jgi:hypothetical protein
MLGRCAFLFSTAITVCSGIAQIQQHDEVASLVLFGVLVVICTCAVVSRIAIKCNICASNMPRSQSKRELREKQKWIRGRTETMTKNPISNEPDQQIV